MSRHRPTELGLTLLMLGAAATGRAQNKPPAAVERPQQAELPFDIPVLPLADALTEFGRQSGLHMVMDAQLGEGRNCGRVRGRYTPLAALDRLLVNTGLSYQYLDEQTIVLALESRPKPTAGVAAFVSGALRVAQADVAEPTTAPPAKDDLQEVIVTSQVVFTQNDAFGATKMGLSIKDTPQTVNVVTSDLMQVAAMQTFKDFYKVDASTGASHVLDGYPRNYFRGFIQQGFNAIRLDGFRVPSQIELDLGILDRFEVIKGATSTLYGQNSIAGMLNAVSKTPQSRFGAELSLELASFDEYRVDADVTGPLGDGDQWSYRLIGVYRDSDSFIDISSYNRKLIAPSLQWQPSETTRVIFRATYQEDDDHYAWAPALQYGGNGSELDPNDPEVIDNYELTRVQREGLKYLDVPRSRYFAMPWNGVHKESKFFQVQAEHELASGWKLRANAQANNIKTRLNNYVMGGPFDQDGFAYFSSAYSTITDSNYYGGEVNLFGNVELFGREHTVFFGADYIDTTKRVRFGFDPIFTPFNAFHPDYSAVPARTTPNEYGYIYDGDNEQALFGATVQLITHPTDRLSVMLGGRYSQSTLSSKSRTGESVAEVESKEFTGPHYDFKDTVGQLGATYKLNEVLNLYATYGETFEPKTDRTYIAGSDNGELIQPEVGKAYEAGIKGELHRDLAFSAAVFDMERTNISQDDRDHPGYAVAVGTQRSKGVELAMQGKLLPQLTLSASVAWLDAKFVKGEFAGLQPPNAPKFGISAYGTYELLYGALKGLGFGMGVVHKEGLKGFDTSLTQAAQARGEGPVNFDFGDFTELDARLFYNRARWSASLGVTNLLDEKYYSQTFSNLRYGVNVNPGTAIRGRIAIKF